MHEILIIKNVDINFFQSQSLKQNNVYIVDKWTYFLYPVVGD